VRSGGRYRGCTCWRDCRAVTRLDEVGSPAADEPLANRADVAPHALVAHPDPSGGDFDLGVVLFVARMLARCRNGLLLFRSHLHDHRLRRCSSGEAVAAARADRGLNGHPHVRFVRGLPLRGLEPRLSIAARRSPRRLHHK
jgi:hypothetical protein